MSSAREARSLIAADVLISTNRDVDAGGARDDRPPAGRRPARPARTETLETPTMVRPADGDADAARMVELRAVSQAFPLYGTVDARAAATRTRTICCRTAAPWSGRSC